MFVELADARRTLERETNNPRLNVKNIEISFAVQLWRQFNIYNYWSLASLLKLLLNRAKII